MQTVFTNCAGIDVHKKFLVACCLSVNSQGQPHKEIRTFGTMTGELEELAGWLAGLGCTHIVIESTGVFWQPIFNILEDRFQVWLVNPQHVKHVPGRKTDVQDAEWLAQLMQHGLRHPPVSFHLGNNGICVTWSGIDRRWWRNATASPTGSRSCWKMPI